MKRSAAEPTRGSGKTILDNGHYQKCAACRPARRAALNVATASWGDLVGRAALPPSEATAYPLHAALLPICVTGALLQRT
jgi:hypothetical protein